MDVEPVQVLVVVHAPADVTLHVAVLVMAVVEIPASQLARVDVAIMLARESQIVNLTVRQIYFNFCILPYMQTKELNV